MIVETAPWTPGVPISDSFFVCLFLSLFVSTVILVVHVYLWINGSRSFKHGVKDMCGVKDKGGPPKQENGVSLLERKRNVYERQRIWMAIPRWFTRVIFRRIKFVIGLIRYQK